MNFRLKIWMLPLCAATVFVAGSAVSYLVGARTSAALADLREQAYPFKEHADQFSVLLDRFRATVQAAAAEGDPAKLDEARAEAVKAEADASAIAALPSYAGTGKGLATALDAYVPAAIEAAKAMAGKGDTAASLQRMKDNGDTLDSQLGTARKQSAAAVQELLGAADRGVERGLFVLLATGLVTLVALGVASALIVRSVWGELGGEPAQLRDVVARIADGDLTAARGMSGDGVSLSESLGRMTERLRSTVAGIREGAEAISTASSEITSGSQDLSQRTERTSSSLQQTASAMAEMTATVRQTADSAVQASKLAHQASRSAQRGGEIVEGVVQNMNEITDASRRIGEIIGVIDGIAHQTNILALNAAVEAAQAGEQGRSFAVVAAEVRTLAQRSAQAAREIKALLLVSSDKVEVGARSVQDAGSAMSGIVADVQRVADIIGEITIASSEQSSGIGHVNNSVGQLDEMTQQNAALVEESAAAAASLRDQAQRLADAMRLFKVEVSD